MLINSEIALSAERVLLVPYCKHHVPVYHEWMQDAELREATASEELTMDEEDAMQRSWRSDRDKLTFIICKPLPEPFSPRHITLQANAADGAEHMIGDINLFLYPEDGEGDSSGQLTVVGEIELMIAGKDTRRQGYGRAALLVFLSYINLRLADILQEHSTLETNLAHLRVKINKNNNASISLFKSVGFQLLSPTPNYFDELELRSGLGEHLPSDHEFLQMSYDPSDED